MSVTWSRAPSGRASSGTGVDLHEAHGLIALLPAGVGTPDGKAFGLDAHVVTDKIARKNRLAEDVGGVDVDIFVGELFR